VRKRVISEAVKGGGRRANFKSVSLKGKRTIFFIITGVEITYILMKRAGKFMTIHEERWNMRSEQINICNIHPVFTLGWRLIIRKKQISAPDIRRGYLTDKERRGWGQ